MSGQTNNKRGVMNLYIAEKPDYSENKPAKKEKANA